MVCDYGHCTRVADLVGECSITLSGPVSAHSMRQDIVRTLRLKSDRVHPFVVGGRRVRGRARKQGTATMVGSKRPASLRSDTSLAKRPRLNNKVAPRRKFQSAEKTGHPTDSDSDNSTSEVEEDNDEQSPANDQGYALESPGNDVPSTVI